MSNAGGKAPRILGLDRRKNHQGECGLCGQVAALTKTHVPPQCAGNTAAKVTRVRLIVGNGPARRTTPRDGGLYVFGLCQGCNGLEAKYDAAYGELAKSLRHLWAKDWRIILTRVAPPNIDARLGGVARSILIGFFGVNPGLRNIYPQLAQQLLNEDPAIIPPADLQLRLALVRGSMAVLTGPTGGFLHNLRVPGGGPYGISNLAQAYLPPLGWQLIVPHQESKLVASDTPSLLNLQGWADVTSWISEHPATLAKIRSSCPSLPVVAHPRHDPKYAESWVEMLSENTELLESLEVAGSILI